MIRHGSVVYITDSYLVWFPTKIRMSCLLATSMLKYSKVTKHND